MACGGIVTDTGMLGGERHHNLLTGSFLDDIREVLTLVGCNSYTERIGVRILAFSNSSENLANFSTSS